jgi:hypothetical protein
MAVQRTTLYDHIKKHDDVLDPMLKRHDNVLFGEKGDNGLCLEVKQLSNSIKTIGIPILIALIITIIQNFIK